MRYLIFFALALSGCSAVPAPDVNYITETETITKSNVQQLELKGKALELLKELEDKKMELENALAIEKLKLANKEPESKVNTVAPDISHCEDYRDEYPERFATCLEDEINGLSTGDGRQYVNTPSIIVSGDNNVVTIGSPAAVNNMNSGHKNRDEDNQIANALIGLINKDTFIPLPKKQAYKHPVAQAIEETKGLVKELAYPVLYGVLGWKGFGAIEKGIEKDSFRMDGNITRDSNNPVTTTTYQPAAAIAE